MAFSVNITNERTHESVIVTFQRPRTNDEEGNSTQVANSKLDLLKVLGCNNDQTVAIKLPANRSEDKHDELNSISHDIMDFFKNSVRLLFFAVIFCVTMLLIKFFCPPKNL